MLRDRPRQKRKSAWPCASKAMNTWPSPLSRRRASRAFPRFIPATRTTKKIAAWHLCPPDQFELALPDQAFTGVPSFAIAFRVGSKFSSPQKLSFQRRRPGLQCSLTRATGQSLLPFVFSPQDLDQRFALAVPSRVWQRRHACFGYLGHLAESRFSF